MIASQGLYWALLLPLGHAADTILGIYLISRHGDRTSKLSPPTVLTPLGIEEAYENGVYFRDRYIDSTDDSTEIEGISTDTVKLAQISPTAPGKDNVLQISAQAFLQGLYPPVPQVETLRGGKKVQTPTNLQFVPVQNTNSAGAILENTVFLQGGSGCGNAVLSSVDYLSSPEYLGLLNSTRDFYKRLDPIINKVFPADRQSFENAYGIFDYINVALVHNATIPSDELLDADTIKQLQALANDHEFNLAYNKSAPIRAIAGATLAGDIVTGLNQIVINQGKKVKLNAQFNAYGFFLSFFGLAQLPKANPNFYGLPDYASSMVFELFTKGPANPFPPPEALYVRFLFQNGTSNSTNEPDPYPLFGQSETELPWSTFTSEMGKISVSWGQQWCTVCGNSTGTCDMKAPPATTSSSNHSSSGSGGVSKAVAGVIGALVTLAVVLGIAALVVVIGGMRLVNKKRLSQRNGLEAGQGNGAGSVMTKSS